MTSKNIKSILDKNLNKDGVKFILELLNNYEVKEFYRLSDIKLTEQLSQVSHDINHILRCLVIADRLVRLFKKLGVKYEQVEKGLCDEKEVNMCIFAAIVLHDIGNAICRNIHHEISAWLSVNICKDSLKLYFPKNYPLFLSMITSQILRHQFYSSILPKDIAAVIVGLSDKLDIAQERKVGEKRSLDFINIVTGEILEINLYSKQKKVQIDILIKNQCALFRVERLKGFIDKLPPKLQKILNLNVYLVKFRKKVKWL